MERGDLGRAEPEGTATQTTKQRRGEAHVAAVRDVDRAVGGDFCVGSKVGHAGITRGIDGCTGCAVQWNHRGDTGHTTLCAGCI